MGFAFISYSTKNKESAILIKNIFNQNHIETWIAPNDIPTGSTYAESVSKAIKNCSCLVLLLTNDSQNSPWVAKEVEQAINYKKVIIPIQLEDVILNDAFELYINTVQIFPLKKIDGSSSEMQNLLFRLNTHTGSSNPEDLSTSETPNEYPEKIPIGTIINGRYKITTLLEQQGFYQSFLVLDEKINKTWVLKAIPTVSEQGNVFLKKFSMEISLIRNLDHPGIPRIVDIFNTNKHLLIVMDYIEGVFLDHVIRTTGAQSEDVVLQWAIQLADILCFLHYQNPAILYNDLWPGNILLKSDGRLILMNWESTQKTDSCTPALYFPRRPYAAPEKYIAEKIDERTDIYALGVTLYSIITGMDPEKMPFEIYPIRKVNPELSKGFEYILSKCMHPHPDNRYQTADALLFDLQNIDNINYQLDHPSLFQKISSIFKPNK